jgi:hypothetical protein
MTTKSIPNRGKDKRRLYTFFIIFFIICFLFQVFPLEEVANRPTPIVLGMPFLMFWITMWIVIEFIGLIILYYLDVIKGGESE